MWRYILIHTLWFCILFLVHFFGGRRDRLVVGCSIAGISAYLAWRGAMDPFSWWAYSAYSAATFAASGRFRGWALSRLDRMSERLNALSRQLDEEKGLLAHRTRETGALDQRAGQIYELYERVKEMSRCDDPLEAFLIFGEALAEHFPFETVKLCLFAAQSSDDIDRGLLSLTPSESFEIRYERLTGAVNRPAFLEAREKLRAPIEAFDEEIFKRLLTAAPKSGPPRRSALTGERPDRPVSFTAFPVYVRDRLVAVLTLTGMQARDLPLYYILVERFAGELQRIDLYAQVQLMATHDALTDVYVRRHLMERLEDEVIRCRRQGLPLSFLMIDIDHFKRVNDQFGHLTGDVVLKEAAKAIKKSVREADLVGRYGGEEFGVILFETDAAAAWAVAERIRRSVEEAECTAFDTRHRVTVSVGLAASVSGEKDARTLIDQADEALYRAKNEGRNAVRAYES